MFTYGIPRGVNISKYETFEEKTCDNYHSVLPNFSCLLIVLSRTVTWCDGCTAPHE